MARPEWCVSTLFPVFEPKCLDREICPEGQYWVRLKETPIGQGMSSVLSAGRGSARWEPGPARRQGPGPPEKPEKPERQQHPPPPTGTRAQKQTGPGRRNPKTTNANGQTGGGTSGVWKIERSLPAVATVRYEEFAPPSGECHQETIDLDQLSIVN